MDTTMLNVMLVLWILGWSSLLFTLWVWYQVTEVKVDRNQINSLLREKAELKRRIEGMEKAMMKNGYRPPHR